MVQLLRSSSSLVESSDLLVDKSPGSWSSFTLGKDPGPTWRIHGAYPRMRGFPPAARTGSGVPERVPSNDFGQGQRGPILAVHTSDGPFFSSPESGDAAPETT